MQQIITTSIIFFLVIIQCGCWKSRTQENINEKSKETCNEKKYLDSENNYLSMIKKRDDGLFPIIFGKSKFISHEFINKNKEKVKCASPGVLIGLEQGSVFETNGVYFVKLPAKPGYELISISLMDEILCSKSNPDGLYKAITKIPGNKFKFPYIEVKLNAECSTTIWLDDILEMQITHGKNKGEKTISALFYNLALYIKYLDTFKKSSFDPRRLHETCYMNWIAAELVRDFKN